MPVNPQVESFTPADAVQEIMDVLNATGAFKHVDQWLEQPFYETEEPLNPAPAAFVEFLGGDYDDMSERGAQIGAVLFKIWIEVDSNAETWIGSTNQTGGWDWNECCIAAHRALQGKELESLSARLTRMNWIREQNTNLGVIIYSMTYKTMLTDASAVAEQTTAPVNKYIPIGDIIQPGEEYP